MIFSHPFYVMKPEFTLSDAIFVEAQLGNPQASCKGFGICTIDALPPEQWDAYTPYHICRVKAQLICLAPGLLQVTFPLSGMLTVTRAHFFRTGYFLIEAPLILPEGISQVLRVADRMVWAGKYACSLLDDSYITVFPLQNSMMEASNPNAGDGLRRAG